MTKPGPGCGRQEPAIDHRKLRVALVGPGRIARAHLNAIRHAADIAELVAIAGLPEDRDKTQRLAEEFQAWRAVDDFEEVVSASDIDGLVLTVPNHLHEPLAVRALEDGKHVLVEKPLANSLRAADTMIAASRRANRVLMVAQCRRFFPGALELKDRMANLGSPVTMVHLLGQDIRAPQAAWWTSARETGGLVLGLLAPHFVDTTLWLMNRSPDQVYARLARLKDVWEGEDEATVVMAFADGSTATGHLSFNACPEINERWITAPEGSLRLSRDRTLWIHGKAVVEGREEEHLEGDQGFNNQFREFACAIREGRQPIAAAAEVRATIEVLDAARRSAKEGVVIRLGSS
jgi:predicted dehydrogenase